MFRKLLLLSIVTLALFAFDKAVPSGEIMGTSSCPVCHMDIKKYYKTSHAIVYKDGTKEHFCSMSCLSKTMAKRNDIETIYVADASTAKMIKAKSATYIIGSDISSTMGAKKSRLAFGSKSGAIAFQKEHGGAVGNFTDALNAD